VENNKFREIKYRVSASVNPTTETLQFLCLKLLRVQGNRIIAERARDSSGRVPLYDYHSIIDYLSFSVLMKRGKLAG